MLEHSHQEGFAICINSKTTNMIASAWKLADNQLSIPSVLAAPRHASQPLNSAACCQPKLHLSREKQQV
jgi:hypothetical protein